MYMDIGNIIKEHRKQSRLSQAELARLAGVGRTAVFDVEHGKQSVQWDTLTRILRVLNITVTLRSPLLDSRESEMPFQRVTKESA
jgi:HTH-type transcriptional regulator / antitoxin HipB